MMGGGGRGLKTFELYNEDTQSKSCETVPLIEEVNLRQSEQQPNNELVYQKQKLLKCF
jgi:hypothetical protein